jgi:hypothetical protein
MPTKIIIATACRGTRLYILNESFDFNTKSAYVIENSSLKASNMSREPRKSELF